MASFQRGLIEMFHDFDRRARPGREPKNRAISKFQTISDVVVFSSDVSAVDGTFDNPVYWVGTSTPSTVQLIWALGQWSSS